MFSICTTRILFWTFVEHVLLFKMNFDQTANHKTLHFTDRVTNDAIVVGSLLVFTGKQVVLMAIILISYTKLTVYV